MVFKSPKPKPAKKDAGDPGKSLFFALCTPLAAHGMFLPGSGDNPHWIEASINRSAIAKLPYLDILLLDENPSLESVLRVQNFEQQPVSICSVPHPSSHRFKVEGVTALISGDNEHSQLSRPRPNLVHVYPKTIGLYDTETEEVKGQIRIFIPPERHFAIAEELPTEGQGMSSDLRKMLLDAVFLYASQQDMDSIEFIRTQEDEVYEDNRFILRETASLWRLLFPT